MFRGDMIELGDFELTTPVMRVSDPCYSRDVWCCGTIDNCQVGTWESAILKSDDPECDHRVSALIVRVKNRKAPKFTAINRAMCNGTGTWKKCGFEVGVDSGQAGFFDEAHYQDEDCIAKLGVTDRKYDDLWYTYCCNLTLSEMSAGILPYGTVSTSGFGDGGYDCIIHHDAAGKVDFAFIIFLD